MDVEQLEAEAYDEYARTARPHDMFKSCSGFNNYNHILIHLQIL